METLDKSKPCRTVWGDAGAVKFEQDGLPFDANGNEIEPKAPKAKPDPAPAPKLAEPAKRDEPGGQVAAQLKTAK